ncbi:MAG: HAD family hydrolase [Candidatus Heimdallarchaeota archaeon]|nr:MAG: HAD family hydrolase [Candidatus Heimdallarchaeota archaeon]
MIKGIVFDIDGTLLNHEQALERSLISLYSLMKKQIPNLSFDEFFVTWKTKTDHYINEYLDGCISFEQQRILRVQSVFSNWGYELSSDEAMDVFNRYLFKYEQNWRLYEDALPCLTMVKNFSLGIISDGDGEQQRRKLAVTKIDSFFTSIIISGEVGQRKPNYKIFEMSARDLNLSLDEIVYVGDLLENDALGAFNAGMHGVLIDRMNKIHEKYNIRIISRLTELPQLIEKF